MLSFIVPAHNEELLLGATLDAIRNAAELLGEPYELIVVDDASTDQTAFVARNCGARVISVANRQISATRNSGAHAAKGELLVFVDADTRVDGEVVRAAVQAVRDGAVGGGAAIKFDGSVPLYAHLLLPILIRTFRAKRLAAGCFVFCTKSAFLAVGGFDEAYYGAEEIVFSRALRRQGRFVVLRLAVTTSGRKFRTYSAWEILTMMFRVARQGRKGVQRRQGLELWYGERRADPQRDAPVVARRRKADASLPGSRD